MPTDETPSEETSATPAVSRGGQQRRALWLAIKGFPFREPGFRNRPMAARAAVIALLVASAIFGVMAGLMLVFSINLPQMDQLERYRPSTTTQLYDIHGKVFGSFALERRVVVPYSEIPAILREAILSIEDKDFESNGGVNLVRVVAAAYRDIHSHGKAQGASTLTMQLARNLFLSSQKTYGRKLQEMFLTLQIERHFTKEQIFTLYANQIYLGRGTYGFEAGSEYYFSKHARDLTLAEAATLAGLPKGPEAYSPVRYPERALKRRNLVLSEMLLDKKITAQQAEAAKALPLGLHLEQPVSSEAPYFVEEVRRQLEMEYGAEAVHGAGLRVFTSLDLNLQRVANKAVLDGTAAYERRHKWKGGLENILTDATPGDDTLASYEHPDWAAAPQPGGYFHALVTEVSPAKMVVRLGKLTATMTQADWVWTQQPRATSLAKVGDIVYVRVTSAPAVAESLQDLEADAAPSVPVEKPKVVAAPGGPGAGATPEAAEFHVVLEQDSGAQASMMAVDNENGEVLAMVGGRDFALSQFNRATQAQRQVGSSFKPYVYATAMAAGMKPTDTVLDTPTTFYSGSGPYTPHNYEADYRGAMTLTEAFAESRNIPALRLADKVGIKNVIAMARNFGVKSPMPNFLPVAIGAADLTLVEQVGSYSVFPNDGIRIAPHYIRRVEQADGLPLEQKTPEVREVIPVALAREMMVLLRAVTDHGTAAASQSLKHPFGGKTGTTNSYTDAWFIGFSPSVTCGTWIGFDNRESLGEKETGAKAALPMWMDFMRVAIADHPGETFSRDNAPQRKLEVAVVAAPSADADKTEDETAADPDSDQAPATPAPQKAPPVELTPDLAPLSKKPEPGPTTTPQ